MSFNYLSVSEIGLKRSENEDSLGTYKVGDGILAIVCDGLGGNKAGEVASKITVDTIYTSFVNDSRDIDNLEKIKNAIEEANTAVLSKSSKDFGLKGMATTVEVLWIKDNTAYWGHVGDSRIYMIRNGKLKQLTKDHSLVQKLVDEGHLTYKEAEKHPNKNIIMRAIGDNNLIEIDVSKLKFSGNEQIVFFICTDGVTTVLNDYIIEQILSGNELTIEQKSQKLSDAVMKRGAPDNFSYILISSS